MQMHFPVLLVVVATLCPADSNSTPTRSPQPKSKLWIANNSTSSDNQRQTPYSALNTPEPQKLTSGSGDGALLSSVVERWRDLEILSAKLALHLVFDNLMPTLDQLFEENNVSFSCQSSVHKVLRDAAALKKYAVQILDSSGKFPPSGMLEGTLTDLGCYDECLEVDEMLEGDDNLVSTRMKGQYCSVLIRPPLPDRPRFHTLCNQVPSLLAFSAEKSAFRWLGENAQYFYYTPFRIGLCSPSQCSATDVQAIVMKFASRFNMTAELLSMKCDINGQASTVNRTQLFCLMAFALTLLLVLTGTYVDVYRVGDGEKTIYPLRCRELQLISLRLKNDAGVKDANAIHYTTKMAPSSMYWVKSVSDQIADNHSFDSQPFVDCSQWIQMLRCFSIQRNGAAILKLEDGRDVESLEVIHGLRVITMAWIILGHTYGLVNPHIHSRVFSAKELYTNFLFQGLLNATLSVDTFFFISGILTVYTFWKRILRQNSGTRTFPWITFTVLRYIRLTPAYAAVIALAFVFPLFSSGPLWQETVEPIAEACYESWWTNLLYINNFVKTDKLCLMHSWYLSDDMQMHLFAILFILLLLRSKILAFLLMVVAMIACTAYSAIQTFVNEYPPTIISTSPVVEDRWKYILDYYYKPWPHLPSYCIGLGLGFLLASKYRSNLTSAQTRTVWIFVSLLCFAMLYGVYPWNMGWEMGPEVTALYSSTFRTTWTACCAWFTFSLSTSYSKGFLWSLLSWKGFLPFSRLTYMAFLVHPFVIWYYSGSVRERFTPSHFNYFHLFLGHYLLTYILSLALGLCFESPFMALQKLLFPPDVADKVSANNKIIPAGRSTSKQTASVALPPLPLSSPLVRRDPFCAGTSDGETEALSMTKEAKKLQKRESFVYHVQSNVGSQSTVLYVNTV